jgi:hypothetical protein
MRSATLHVVKTTFKVLLENEDEENISQRFSTYVLWRSLFVYPVERGLTLLEPWSALQEHARG